VLAVGLTGGIGSGKSALADLWVERGAELVDSDQIARDVVEAGSATLGALVERFGDAILTEDGSLDRQRLADLAFVDTESVEALNHIVHPAIRADLAARRESARRRSGVCLFAIPLLTADHTNALDLHKIVVVDCPVDVAIDRLVAHRGFSETDAAARVASQITREERLGLADFVVLNDGDLAQLETQADALWDRLLEEASNLG
jgi:dephospho-CoA kinase